MSHGILEDELNQIDNSIAYSPEILGIECSSCRRLLAHKFYRRDSSLRTGYKPQCMVCESAPKLTMEEHLFQLREKNHNADATRKQRHPDQEEMRKTDARLGRPMHCSEFLLRLQKLVPSLFVKEGGIVGDLALYQVADAPQAKWDGKNYNYVGFISYDMLPEFSRYQFDDLRDVMIRESERGWRTVLLRFIKAGLLTEEQCSKEFGPAIGQGSMVWYKQLFLHRNEKVNPEQN
jgi:hypothetical protein